jgi:hypothetical protein
MGSQSEKLLSMPTIRTFWVPEVAPMVMGRADSLVLCLVFGITFFEFRWLCNKGHYDTYDADPD